MAYRISKSDGSIITVNDYQFDTTNSSLTLVGRGQINFGEPTAANFVHLLENFSYTSPPANPMRGQLWFRPSDPMAGAANRMKVFIGPAVPNQPLAGWANVGTPSASPNPPLNPELGELWFDTVHQKLYFWSGSSWELTNTAYAKTTPPVVPTGDTDLPDGTTWLMMPECMMWVWDNALAGPEPTFTRLDNTALAGKWRLIGAAAPRQSGTYIVGRYLPIVGNATPVNWVMLTYSNNQIVSIESSAPTFVTNTSDLPGFVSIQADGTADAANQVTVHNGLTINQTNAGARFGGKAINSTLFDSEVKTSFLGNGASANVLTTPVSNNAINFGSAALRWNGLFAKDVYAGSSIVGTDDVSVINLHGKAASAAVADTVAKWTTPRTIGMDPSWFQTPGVVIDGSQNVQFNFGGFGATANAAIKAIADSSAGAAVGNAAAFIKKDGSSTGFSNNMGSAGDKFNTIFATTFNGNATSANYADLGERYESDTPYPVGTIVKIGGDKGITATTQQLDPDVFGVISENPGFILNDGAGSDDTHPVVGLVGRVRVRIAGFVKKGQRIVTTSIPGVGVATDLVSGIDVFCVVGRALEDKDTPAEGLVLCAIGMK
jgi:hypothetical protein